MARILNLILGIFIICFGIFLWNNPMESLITYCLYIALTYFISATIILIVSLFNKETPTPWITVIWDYVIALIIFCYPSISLFFFLWLFIVGYLIMASLYFYNVWTNRQHIKYHITKIILALVGIGCGIAMLVDPTVGFGTLAKLVSLAIILSGCSYVLPTLLPR